MLSPQIAEFVRKTRMNDGFDLREVPKDTLLKVETRDLTFFMLVLDSQQCKVALKADYPELREPQVFFHQGATGGGSMVKLGWIGVGLYLRMNPSCGGLMTIPLVKSFEIIQDETIAHELRTAGEKFDSEKPITKEEFDEITKEFVVKNFPSEHQSKIQQFVDQFCSEGKGVILGVLDRAHRAGKLQQALHVLEQQFHEHWTFRPKQFRGSFITEQDVFYVEEAYRQLGLPSPGET